MHCSLPRLGLLALSVVLSGSVLVGAAEPGNARASSPTELKKLYIVLAFDTDSNMAPTIQVDRQRLHQRLVARAQAELGKQCEVKEFTGTQLTAKNVLAYFRDEKVKVDAQTGLVFLYSGHGSTDDRRGHFLDLTNGGPLVRSELRRAMEARKPGLVVLLTDCCGNRGGYRLARMGRPRIDGPLGKGDRGLFRTLFLEARGTVDITAALEGTASWGDANRGGLFTWSLCELLQTPRRGPMSWKKFYAQLETKTEETFKDWKRGPGALVEGIEAASQKPHAYFLPTTYAVVSLDNTTEHTLQLTYRWPGQPEWVSAELGPHGKLPVFVEIAEPGKKPELECRLGSQEKIYRLQPRIWTGSRQPAFADGEPATIERRARVSETRATLGANR
jgi:hypothetical protein